ncbi:MAG TPA: Flp pilus assembly protein CpaB [Stellaceae bacterium]|nr:Flp pilus assembly protein CpaB [Stellaceae bacterium]
MSLRRLLFVFIALCASAGTVLIGRVWLAPQRVAAAAPVPAPQEPVTHVLVAQGKLNAGQFVRPENLRWQAWPKNGVATGYFVEGRTRIEDFVGSVVRSAMSDGEPITDGKIVRPGDRGFMAAVLTPGYRAVTVPVTVSSGIAGFVFPGDRVDLILTMTVRDATGKLQRHASETLLTDLRVLAVDQRADDQNKQVVVEKTATLEVTPKQAEIIAVATDLGNLSLSLRSLARADGTMPSLPPFSHTWDTQATHITFPTEQKQGPAPIKVSLVRGSKVVELQFARSVP